MKLKIFTDSMMHQNLYLYYDEQSKKGVIIDPGGHGNEVLSFIEQQGIEIQMILLTHGHFDHIASLEKIRATTKAPVAIHKEETVLLGDGRLNGSSNTLQRPLEFTADRFLEDGETLPVGSSTLTVLYTPGHTPGGLCYYDEQEKLIFTGDTLFLESVGRSDFPLGNGEDLIFSIREKLFTLPLAVKVYPGHSNSTTIGHELTCNPFVS